MSSKMRQTQDSMPKHSLIGKDRRMPQLQYLEDLAVGQVFRSGTLLVEEAEINQFAAIYDPRPFYLDAEAAKATLFRGLAASGWHTAAMTMRLLTMSPVKPAGGPSGPVSMSCAGLCRYAPEIH
ncbi:MaoC/PaaZ C-terminal domain-containing protein [Agrobacterium tumefaciens]|uniref:MaoC/PaaZ C-terminal domain-containing protein n=1 Tax=Agrobacterium tumefaciens TaxID=358 RepID=UPI00384DA977